ncbi:ABC transporter ATP-binding protein [Catenulispora yoronensis]|uniref:ABC transporter ATP-binding protein n=1 Tax=Catenulispora yoronensis TaxID=450799 RepID=A0ABN2UQI6_9ACTN
MPAGPIPTTLDDLEADAVRPRPRYGHDAHIVCDNLVRIYRTEGVEVQALQGLDLLVGKGDLVAVVGASGSGKSTLLNILSGLDAPTAGAASVAGCDLLTMKARDRLRYRREVVGFVWQQTGRNLFSHLDAMDNVMLPMSYAGTRGAAAERRTAELLEMLAVGHVRDRRPGQLSGGEQQRVAIAVALANAPEVLFADEPTGELDSATAEQVFEALRTANRELGVTVVVVTHDALVAGQVRRTVAIRDGRTSSETVREAVVDADGAQRDVAEEYVMLDRAGRMQLPREFVERLGMRDRVRVALDEDHVSVWPTARETTGAQAAPGEPAV